MSADEKITRLGGRTHPAHLPEWHRGNETPLLQDFRQSPDGYDGGKKIKGRKRHIIVDTLGLLLAVVVTAGDVDDGVGAPEIVGKLKPEAFPRLETIFGDNKYRNKKFQAWLQEYSQGKWRTEISNRPADAEGFVPLPVRWVVERTFAWIGRYRRNSKDYEKRTDSSESMVLISSMSLMLRRLKPPEKKEPPFKYPKPAKLKKQ